MMSGQRDAAYLERFVCEPSERFAFTRRFHHPSDRRARRLRDRIGPFLKFCGQNGSGVSAEG
jgi:hypothetical protein